MRRTQTIVIGGGQAGLAMSRCLTDARVDHVVLERGRVGERWRNGMGRSSLDRLHGGTACGSPSTGPPRTPAHAGGPRPREVSAWAGCPLRHLDRLDCYELGLELGLAIFEEHADNFLQVRLQFIERLALAVGTRPPRHMADEQSRVRVAFDDDAEGSHAARILLPAAIRHVLRDRRAGRQAPYAARCRTVSEQPGTVHGGGPRTTRRRSRKDLARRTGRFSILAHPRGGVSPSTAAP